MSEHTQRIKEIVSDLLKGNYAWVESELEGTSYYDAEVDIINKRGDVAVEAIEQLIREARIDEASHYCDDGHYHDKKRDLAMLPSERVTELKQEAKEK